ncbi:MAG: hypothetical protein IPL71_15795 [Anaerolineales bacterium]|nr:hypothetical protein [Anaerolineales bacterium]
MNTQQLNETISKTLAAWNIPGAAVAIAQSDEIFAPRLRRARGGQA